MKKTLLISAIVGEILVIILLITTLVSGKLFKPISHIEKLDHEMTIMLKGMKYNECKDPLNSQFGYLIDRIRASERAGKIVQFGTEEFKVFHYDDSTDVYPYRLCGETFSVWINPKSVFPDRFVMMKTWDFPRQDKYNK